MPLNKYIKNEVIRMRLALFLCFFSCLLCSAYLFGAMARSGLAFEALATLPKSLIIVWKGAAELLLVLAAWIVVQSKTAYKLALSVAIIFVADIALALEHLPLAGAIFALAHLLAAFSYISSRPLPPAKLYTEWLSIVPLASVLLLVFFSVWNNSFQVIIFFPAFSAFAAWSALRSCYPLALNGIGAILLWMSDFIFVLTVAVHGDVISVSWLVWLTFSSGLILIVFGLVTFKSKEVEVMS